MTAVEWLEDNFGYVQSGNMSLRYYFKQAKEMEKEQMFEYIKDNYCIGHRSLEFHRLEFEQYYNEKYDNNRQD